ncbi:unnamed protein product [Arctogadus glacialis]
MGPHTAAARAAGASTDRPRNRRPGKRGGGVAATAGGLTAYQGGDGRGGQEDAASTPGRGPDAVPDAG